MGQALGRDSRGPLALNITIRAERTLNPKILAVVDEVLGYLIRWIRVNAENCGAVVKANPPVEV
jgi:hypothetical protein